MNSRRTIQLKAPAVAPVCELYKHLVLFCFLYTFSQSLEKSRRKKFLLPQKMKISIETN